MKISSISQALNLLGRVGERKNTDSDRESGSSGYESPHHQKHSEPHSSENESNTETSSLELELSEEMIDQAIQSFMQAPAQQTAGLKVHRVGRGSELTVMIQDINGTIIRQCSGKEFLRLQKNSSKDARVRGRFLDQKL